MGRVEELEHRPSQLIPGHATQRGRTPGPTCATRDPGVLEKSGYVSEAFAGVGAHLQSAIIRHTTEDFAEIIRGILPGLVLAAGTVVLTTLAGAGIGALFGGVGAVPGAILGAKVGMAILTYLGLGFLAMYVLEHIGEAGTHFESGISRAWNSCGVENEIHTASREIAEGIGVLFSLLVQAMLVFLLRQGSKGMGALRQSKFFKWCPRLETWLQENFIRLCFRYKIKEGIMVISGGRVGPGRFAQSLALARAVLTDMMGGNHPRFTSFKALHQYLTTQKGFRLVKDPKQTMVYGPKDPGTGRVMKDAAQAIYTSADGTVVVKVKTRGYDWGGRKNGTMSIEVTDGGSGWSNVLAKISREGEVVAKTRLAERDVVVLSDGVYALSKGGKMKLDGGAKLDDLSKGGFGSDLRKVVEFELIEGGGVKPMDPNAFANKGHIDFAEGFNPEGAWSILQLTP